MALSEPAIRQCPEGCSSSARRMNKHGGERGITHGAQNELHYEHMAYGPSRVCAGGDFWGADP